MDLISFKRTIREILFEFCVAIGTQRMITPKTRCKRLIEEMLSSNTHVINDRILVAAGPNPIRKDGDFATVWIPLVSRELTAIHAREICEKIITIYRSEFIQSWNAIEIYIGGFESGGSFDKAYCLRVFDDEALEIAEILREGLPGRIRGRDIGTLFLPSVTVDLVDL